MRPTGFSDQAVSAQQAQPAPHPAPAPTGFLLVGRWLREKDSLQVAVAESLEGKLTRLTACNQG
jgi:hypothetical protein